MRREFESRGVDTSPTKSAAPLASDGPYFRVELPRAPEIPVVVEVPHAGIQLDPESLALCTAPARSIGRDADLFVDELFTDAPDVGATLLYATASRYVCDLNRASDELELTTSPGVPATAAPHGVVWRRTTEGRPALGSPLTEVEADRRLRLVYEPYHRKLAELIEDKRRRFGFVILLCGHSMPSFGRLGDRRADIVPGTRGRTTAAESIIDAPDRVALEFSFGVAHDQPYRGGFTTGHYGRPHEHIHAIQVEMARRLYMDETSLTRRAGAFERCRAFCRALVTELGRQKLA